METTPNLVSKFLKIAFAFSILVFFGMTFLIEYYVLYDTDLGFINKPEDGMTEMLLSIFVGFSILTLALQFILPEKLRARATTPAAALNVDMIRYALCESIAVLGFLLFLYVGEMQISWIFMAVALLALLFGDRAKQKAL